MKRTLLVLTALVVLFGLAHGVRGQVTDARTLHGQVVDQQGNQIKGGVVYLKSLATQIVRSYISDDEGQYRFSGLDPNADYEIHAETADQTSATRKISRYDDRKDIVLILRVDKKKSDK
jgi:protocatechuate 3,4-dioxygenase beta subunit